MYEDLSCLFAPLEATSEFGALTDALSRPGAALACGLDDAQKLHLTVAAARKLGRPLLFVTSNEVAAQRVREDLNALLGGGAAAYWTSTPWACPRPCDWSSSTTRWTLCAPSTS